MGNRVEIESWLPQPRPRCGPRTRWRDVVRKDLKDIGVKEDDWYEEATRSRAGWKAMYLVGLEDCRETQAAMATVAAGMWCVRCALGASGGSVTGRGTSVQLRGRSLSEQRGAAQCLQCLKWFRSRGGLALHRCEPGSLEGCREAQAAMDTVAGRDVICEVCSRGTRRGTSVWLRDRSLSSSVEQPYSA